MNMNFLDGFTYEGAAQSVYVFTPRTEPIFQNIPQPCRMQNCVQNCGCERENFQCAPLFLLLFWLFLCRPKGGKCNAAESD